MPAPSRRSPSRPLALGACLLAGLAPACADSPPLRPDEPRPLPGIDASAPAKEKEPPIARATRALETGDVVEARRLLEAHLADAPDDAQARYLLARALAAQGELRAARLEVERSLTLDDKSALAWSLLAGLSEQMGEHRRALRAYGRVHELVPQSLDPLHGMARCLLFMGEAQDALAALSAARERPVKDPWTEYLAFQALRRLGRSQEAESVARTYLELVATRTAERAAHADNERDVRRWLEERSQPLDADVRRAMVDAVRVALKLKLPGSADPEDEVLAQGPPRLFVFDQRPVFVTVFPGGGRAPLRGRGRGKSLAAALKGAIQEVQERPGFSPLMVKDAAVQIEVGHTLEPIAIEPGRRGDLETDPPLRRGVHGIAMRVDRQEVYCLPSEPLTAALPDLASMLAHAATQAGLSPDAWQGAPGAFRFETDAWLSPGPGLAITILDRGEPGPLPQALPGELREAALAGARWLTTQLRPDPAASDGAEAASGDASARSPAGGVTLLARAHDPTGRKIDPAEASPADAARVALACALAHRLESDGVLLSAAEHLLGRLRPLLPPATDVPAHDEPQKQAALEADALAALAALAPHGRGASAGLDREALARHLHGSATAATRTVALLGLLRDGARDPRALDDLAGIAREAPRDPLTVVALVTLDEARPDLGAGDRALEWARAQLEGAASGEDVGAIARARQLTALAVTARLAARRGAPEADALRARTLEEARGLLALQLAARHRHFVRNPGLALGGFRARMTQAELRPEVTAECVLALIACVEMLER